MSSGDNAKAVGEQSQDEKVGYTSRSWTKICRVVEVSVSIDRQLWQNFGRIACPASQKDK